MRASLLCTLPARTVAALQQQLHNTQLQRDAMEEEKNQLKEQLDALKRLYHGMEQQFIGMREEMDQMQAERGAMEQPNDQMERERDAMEQRLDAALFWTGVCVSDVQSVLPLAHLPTEHPALLFILQTNNGYSYPTLSFSSPLSPSHTLHHYHLAFPPPLSCTASKSLCCS